MTRSRRRFEDDEKLAVVRRHLLDKVPVSDLCDELGLQPTDGTAPTSFSGLTLGYDIANTAFTPVMQNPLTSDFAWATSAQSATALSVSNIATDITGITTTPQKLGGLKFNVDNTFLSGSTAILDLTFTNATTGFGSGFAVSNFTLPATSTNITAVPEPSSWVFLSLLGCLAGARSYLNRRTQWER